MASNVVLSEVEYNVVGKRPVRPDGVDKVTGRAQYGADLQLTGLLHARVLRSPYAHARINSIDTSAAEAHPGVRAVVTAKDLPFASLTREELGGDYQRLKFASDNFLASDKALYKGHAVAAVAADTVHAAEAALALAREIARQLEPIGIRATVASTSFTVLSRDFLAPRTYDAALAGWDQGPDPDPYLAWHSSQVDHPGGNVANYGDIIVDALLERGRTTSSALVRLDAYNQFQELWQREAPSVILAYPRIRYIRAANVTSPPFGVLFTPTDRFLNVHLWRIE